MASTFGAAPYSMMDVVIECMSSWCVCVCVCVCVVRACVRARAQLRMCMQLCMCVGGLECLVCVHV